MIFGVIAYFWLLKMTPHSIQIVVKVYDDHDESDVDNVTEDDNRQEMNFQIGRNETREELKLL